VDTERVVVFTNISKLRYINYTCNLKISWIDISDVLTCYMVGGVAVVVSPVTHSTNGCALVVSNTIDVGYQF